MPFIPWKEYQEHCSSEEEIRRWYARPRTGLGLLCGHVSGYLELLEFEGRAVEAGLWNDFKEVAKKSGLMPLLKRIMQGFGERSPSGGIHLLYRCPGVAGNLELAKDAEGTILIETRGEGGYVVVAPSNGAVHPSGGAYSMLSGGFESIATIQEDEREALLELARSFDQTPAEEWKPPTSADPEPAQELKPGEDFSRRADWAADVLEPAGWTFTGTHGGRDHWYRKGGGRKGWTSATITPDREFLYVFSTSTELPARKGLSKYRAYAFLQHGGNFSEAASALRKNGYGSQAERGGEIRGEVLPSRRPVAGWPERPHDDAYYGLAGEVVRTVEKYTEGDPAAILGQFLALFGVAVGQRPYFNVGATRHTPRIFVGIVGRSAKARKGDSWAPVERLVVGANESIKDRILGGFGSGEAMVHAVRDAREAERVVKGKVTIESIPGVQDKRLMVVETELARLLVAVGREGSTISQTVRDAYDGRALRNLVKGSPAQAEHHHIGIIGHTTAEELRGRLNEDQIRNGFANRFLWLAAQRSGLKPSPPAFAGDEVRRLTERIRRTIQEASTIGRMERTEDAEILWDRWYREVSEEGLGIIGALTDRAEAHVLRLSMLYALLEGTHLINILHLKAARAVWDYAFRSVRYIFGAGTGNRQADEILEDLEDGPMLQSELTTGTFSNHISAKELRVALDRLVALDLVVAERVKTTGRPATRWRLRS